jgi:hypothetical protein
MLEKNIDPDAQSFTSLNSIVPRIGMFVNNLFLEKLLINYLNEISDLDSMEKTAANYQIQIVAGSIIFKENTIFMN